MFTNSNRTISMVDIVNKLKLKGIKVELTKTKAHIIKIDKRLVN
ncbi:hypothetical protein [Bacillus sp. Marseille-P3661]|nr:hypothetical protein [Bacillus sp. Marseille-P3661]